MVFPPKPYSGSPFLTGSASAMPAICGLLQPTPAH